MSHEFYVGHTHPIISKFTLSIYDENYHTFKTHTTLYSVYFFGMNPTGMMYSNASQPLFLKSC